MTQEQQIRQQLAKALDWGEAHADFRAVVDDFPIDLRGEVPPGFSHSAWELLEHLRIALWDIVEFTQDARHKSPPWPKGIGRRRPCLRRTKRGTSASSPSSTCSRRCAA